MDNKTILKIQKFVETKLNEAENKREEWETKLQSAKEMKEQANTQVMETFNSGDVAAYHAAQDQARTVSDAINMYESKVAALNKEPLITKEEFDSYSSEIIAELDKANKEASKKIARIIDEQIEPIAKEVSDMIIMGNGLIERLQLDLLKDTRAADIPTLIVKYAGNNAYSFVRTAKKSPTYKKGCE